MTRRTKIVATLGPASDGAAQLDSLIAAGVDVVLLNLSHGPIEEHLDRLARQATRAARRRLRLAILTIFTFRGRGWGRFTGRARRDGRVICW